MLIGHNFPLQITGATKIHPQLLAKIILLAQLKGRILADDEILSAGNPNLKMPRTLNLVIFFLPRSFGENYQKNVRYSILNILDEVL